RLALPGGTLTSEFVDFEVKRGLEWLQGERNEARRYSAVLVLKELSTTAPTITYTYIPQILDLIWVALRDAKLETRQVGAEVVGMCLNAIYERDNRQKRQWHKKVYEEAEKSFQSPFKYSNAQKILSKRYEEICKLIFNHKEHGNSVVRCAVITSLPSLAAHAPDAFANDYLAVSMTYLLKRLTIDSDKSDAFIAIGRISVVLKNYVDSYKANMLQQTISCKHPFLNVPVNSQLLLET
ncbi:phosphatidylinositol kinase- protein kinase tor1, partial [Nowakowskiella sp. JEL0078]